MKTSVMHLVYSLEIGGLERVVIHLANNLPPDRYISHICCINTAGDLSTEFNFKDRFHTLGNQGRINLKSLRKLWKTVNGNSIDILHAHNYPGLLYGLPIAKLFRIPLIYTKHGFLKKQDNLALNLIERQFSHAVDNYVCVSKQLKDTIKSNFNVKESKLSIIYNGIPINSSPIDSNNNPEEIVIGSIGRLTQIKNYELLLKSFSILIKTYPFIRLVIFGDGERYDKLTDLSTELQLDNKVSFPGFSFDVDKSLDEIDIYVLPSFTEGHSISLLEAMNKHRICIASRVGGNPEIITDGSNGYLFESNNLEELTNKIAYAIEKFSSEEMISIRERGHETIRTQYSLEAMLNNYAMLYSQFIR